MRVRIELGPRDAQKNQACLAISTTPGEVAKKTSYQVHLQMESHVSQFVSTGSVCANTFTTGFRPDW